MAKVEIEEAELHNLQQVSKFVNGALANPKTRTTLLGVQKTLNPEAVIPELDAADGVMKAVKEVAEAVGALKTDIEKERNQRAEDNRTAELQGRVSKGQEYLRGNGYNEDGIKKVEELMLAENISSYAAGLALFERINPPSQPAAASSARWIAPQGAERVEDNKPLWDSQGDDESWLRNAINGAGTSFRM